MSDFKTLRSKNIRYFFSLSSALFTLRSLQFFYYVFVPFVLIYYLSSETLVTIHTYIGGLKGMLEQNGEKQARSDLTLEWSCWTDAGNPALVFKRRDALLMRPPPSPTSNNKGIRNIGGVCVYSPNVSTKLSFCDGETHIELHCIRWLSYKQNSKKKINEENYSFNYSGKSQSNAVAALGKSMGAQNFQSNKLRTLK